MLVVVLLFSALPQARGVENVAFSVGDEFQFTITDSKSTMKVNGTEYYTPDPSDIMSEGNTVKVSVTSIEEATVTGEFGVVSTTLINYTAEIGDQTYDGYSYLDGWFTGYAYAVLIFAFSTFAASFADFEPPTMNTDDDSMDGDNNQVTMPFFATNNASFYQEMIDELTSTTGETPTSTATDESISIVKDDVSASYDADNKKFSMSTNLKWEGTGDHYSGNQWSGFGELKFEVNIDVARSIVTKLYVSWKMVVEVGDASSEYGFSIGFVEGTDGGAGLPLPGFTWLVASGSLFVMAVAINKKRA